MDARFEHNSHILTAKATFLERRCVLTVPAADALRALDRFAHDPDNIPGDPAQRDTFFRQAAHVARLIDDLALRSLAERDFRELAHRACGDRRLR